MGNHKYSGSKAVSPLTGKEYYVFDDISNTAFKHYVDPSTHFLTHSIMDFCTDANSQALCKDGKSVRYDVHEYEYSQEEGEATNDLNLDDMYTQFRLIMSPWCQEEFVY